MIEVLGDEEEYGDENGDEILELDSPTLRDASALESKSLPLNLNLKRVEPLDTLPVES